MRSIPRAILCALGYHGRGRQEWHRTWNRTTEETRCAYCKRKSIRHQTP